MGLFGLVWLGTCGIGLAVLAWCSALGRVARHADAQAVRQAHEVTALRIADTEIWVRRTQCAPAPGRVQLR